MVYRSGAAGDVAEPLACTLETVRPPADGPVRSRALSGRRSSWPITIWSADSIASFSASRTLISTPKRAAMPPSVSPGRTV